MGLSRGLGSRGFAGRRPLASGPSKDERPALRICFSEVAQLSSIQFLIRYFTRTIWVLADRSGCQGGTLPGTFFEL